MTQHRNMYRALYASVLLCWGASLVAAPSVGWVEDTSAQTEEVPIESIQQFVQIYSMVRAHYVDKKPDEVLFQQSIKGLLSGLDRYSRYLSAEEYQQLVQYTEGDLA